MDLCSPVREEANTGNKENEMIGYKPLRPCYKLTLFGTWEYVVWEFRSRVHWKKKHPVCCRGIVSNLNKTLVKVSA